MIKTNLDWASSGASEPGGVRVLNEDAFLDRPDVGLWVVADGMGGHEAGDLASALVVSTLSEVPLSVNLSDAMYETNAALRRVNTQLLATARERQQSVIGSTVVILLARDNRFACIWAGDSRLYRLRQGVFEQVNHDHSEVQNLIDAGLLQKTEAENHPSANVITRAIGAIENVELDVVQGTIYPGDRFLLCSDGLYRELAEGEISHSMQFDGQPNIIAASLMDRALKRKARDNVTVIAINFSDGDKTIQLSRH